MRAASAAADVWTEKNKLDSNPDSAGALRPAVADAATTAGSPLSL